jgi:hypothetical protein
MGPKDWDHIDKSQLLKLKLDQMNPVLAFTSYFSTIHYETILPRILFPWGFQTKFLYTFLTFTKSTWSQTLKYCTQCARYLV